MSMTPKKKAVSVAAAGVAAAAAIGFGVSGAAQADTTAPTPTTTTSTGAGTSSSTPGGPSTGGGWRGGGPGAGRHGGAGFGVSDGADLTALATKLGVSESALRTALSAVRSELKPTTGTRPAAGPGHGQPDFTAMQNELASKLATKLGIDTAKVNAAFTELRSAAEASRTQAFDDRLAQAVTDGKLTQAEADAVKKAAKVGVIGMGGARGPR